MSNSILIVEDDIAFGKMLSAFLERKDFKVTTCSNGTEARKEITGNAYDLLVTDINLPEDSGMELLDFTRERAADTKVILMTGYAKVESAVEAMKKGALDYISKPFRPEELLLVIEQALKIQETTEETKPISQEKIETTKEAVENDGDDEMFIKGISETSKKFNKYLQLVGPTDMAVMIEGDSGTGKEVAAKTIHNLSNRKDENFVAVDCGAIPAEIASSEFFGHIKGSFTGAINDKKGHFEAANGGTLFLDEVGNLSYQNQIQLLRALQERRIKPVGSNKEIEVDVRIISATNEDLNKAVAEGKFREDLYHRLNEFSIKIPSLHERKEDLFLFTEFFLTQANESLNKNVSGFSKEVEEAFKEYKWPGNLRELKNIIKRSVLLTQGDEVPLEVIPKEVVMGAYEQEVSKDFSKEENEKRLILNALREAGNNKSKAAEMLQITRKTLYNKIKAYNLDV